MFDYLYKLENKVPVKCRSAAEASIGIIINKGNFFTDKGESIKVLTFFTGIDYGDRKLFKTMISGGELDGRYYMTRTFKEAQEVHIKTVDFILFFLSLKTEWHAAAPGKVTAI